MKLKAKIWTKSGCNYCVLAKALLDRENIDYEEISVTPENIQEMRRLSLGFSTVPQIFVDGEWVGGYNDLLRKLEAK